jgi:hypothetical protein
VTTRISDELAQAISRAFRDPMVMEGAEAYLRARLHDLERKSAEAARTALFDRSHAPAALMSLGAKQEVEKMVEILNRWKE